MKSKIFVPFLLACVCLSSCTTLVGHAGNNYEEDVKYTLELEPSVGISVGETRQLVVGITASKLVGNPEITWRNSDSTIISINNSKTDTVTVTGISSGTATVTALVGASASASCTVTVSTGGASDVKVTSITLSETEKDLVYDANGDNSFDLFATVLTTNSSATVTPTWSSTVTSVATVSGSGKSAVVTVKGAGETSIIASAGGKSAECRLHVTSSAGGVNVTLDKKSVVLEVGQTTKLTATTSGAVTSTLWQSDDPSATVTQEGFVEAVSEGSATISVLVSDSEGNTSLATCLVTVKPQGQASEYDEQVAAWSKKGHIYFHYFRDKGDYDNWAIWAWQTKPKSLEGTLWGANRKITNLAGVTPTTFGFMTNEQCGKSGTDVYKDEHGIVIDVDITNELLPGGKTGTTSPLVTWRLWDRKEQTLGFFIVDQTQMTGETNWISDGTGEIYIEDLKTHMPEGKDSFLHVYCVQGAVADYQTTSGTQIIENKTIADKDGIYRSTDDTSLLYKDEYPKGVPTSESFLEDRPGTGYQIFVPSFADSDGDGMGDIGGIINKLEYLDEVVGAKVLWLTPIQKSNSYHGYDVTDYYRIDSKYGTLEQYQQLLYLAHQRGMKVLMDMVINHTSKSNVLFRKSEMAIEEEVNGEMINYRDMYVWKFKGDEVRVWDGKGDNDSAPSHFTKATLGGTEDIDKKLNELWYKDGESDYYYFGKFGSGMAELNYNCEATRKYMTDMCKYWLSFGLDGFRLDATKHIYLLGELNTNLDLSSDDIVYDVGYKHYWNEEQQRYVDVDNDYSYDRSLNVTFWKQFAGNIKSAYPDCFLVGENFDGWDERMAPFYESMDSQFDFQTYFNLSQFYESSIGGKIQNSHNEFKKYRPNGMIDGAFTSNHDIFRLLNHAARHDEDIPLGVHGINHKEVHGSEATGDEENNQTYAINMAKYYAAVTLFTPGISWIYYGDELGMSGNLEDLVPPSGGGVPYNDHGNNTDRWYRQPMRWGTTKGEDEVVDFTFGGIEILWDRYNQNLPTADEQWSQADSMLKYVSAVTHIKNDKAFPTYGWIQAFGSLDGAEKGQCYIEISDGTRTVAVCINNSNRNVSYTKMGWRLLGGFGSGYTASNVPAHGFIVLAK